MKKLCRECYRYIDRRADVCPYCHKPQKVKKEAAKAQSAEKTYPDQAANEPISKNVINDETKGNAPVDSRGRVRWVPKHKREGYKEQQEFLKGTNMRECGRHIDVSDVTYFDQLNGKGKYRTDSPDRKNGFKQEKLKWWEIYMRIDRYFARHKIKKVVAKESTQKPQGVSYWLTLFLSIFTGFLGLHNIYTKNYKRGFWELGLFSWAMLIVILMDYLPWLKSVQMSLCALPALIDVLMWVYDIMALIFKKYQYTQTKLNFIYGLDIETRARLGRKFINVPNWYVYKG